MINQPELEHIKKRASNRELHLIEEIERLRQGLWDCATLAGMDTDGDTTPRALVSDIVTCAKEEVQELRATYDEVVHEVWS